MRLNFACPVTANSMKHTTDTINGTRMSQRKASMRTLGVSAGCYQARARVAKPAGAVFSSSKVMIS